MGDREELSTDGPTLELLRSAEDALEHSDHLVIVGYSFGGAHINSVIRNWMLARADRTIAIVDPGWGHASAKDSKYELLKKYGVNNSNDACRVRGFKGGGGLRLTEALDGKIRRTPSTCISRAPGRREGGGTTVTLMNNGPVWLCVRFTLGGNACRHNDGEELLVAACQDLHFSDPRSQTREWRKVQRTGDLDCWYAGAKITFEFADPSKRASR